MNDTPGDGRDGDPDSRDTGPDSRDADLESRVGDTDLESRIADALGSRVTANTELDGGEVGQVHRVTLADGRTVAAKTSDVSLDVEAYMLAFLDDRGLPVPDRHHESEDLLVMEYVEGDGRLTPAAERDVARHLAALHEETPGEVRPAGETPEAEPPSDAEDPDRIYGFPRDTLSGPYRQPNPWTESWAEFYRDRRLLFVAEAARGEGSLPADLFDRLDALAADLDSLLPASPPSSLVHGDAWAENVVVRDGEVRAFLDPACYFGHAEVELAYADFVGLGDPFFETYEAERGIDAGFFDGRREVYQLYPLLEHLRYFEDATYAAEIRRTLDCLGY